MEILCESLIEEIKVRWGEKEVILKNKRYSQAEFATLVLQYYTLQNLREFLNCGLSTLKTKEPLKSLENSTAPIGRRLAKYLGYCHCSKCRTYKEPKDFYRTNVNDECKDCYKVRGLSKKKYPKDLKLHKFSESKRRAKKLQRTPKWANLDKIKEIYKKCPEGYHVDHIIPLQGALVSGLHTEENLQYLTVFENLSKGNTFEVD